MWSHGLVNPKEPNLYEDIFDYTKIPIINFEKTTVDMNIPKDIWITDTTFRDGQQARPPYQVEQITAIYKYLSKLGGTKGVIRQSEFFLYSTKDRTSVEKCKELGYQFPEITGWIRANKEDFVYVKDLELRETGILTSVSDYHIYLKLKYDRQKAMDKYLEVVDTALEHGIIPRCHFEDITRADFYGFVIPFAQKLMERSKEAGIPIKIRACDTMGFGLPYPNAPLPRSVPKIFDALHKEAGVPHKSLEWHGHNDFHKVLINATTAWLYNCSSVNGTLFGWGERTGNPPIEGLIMDYIALKGGDPRELGIDTTVITDLAKYYHEVIGDTIPSNYPFVGEHFNTTQAGIHADGVMKNERIYNIFNTDKILNRPITVSITDKSGAAGIAYWINSYFKLDDEKKIEKNHTGILGIFAWVKKEYEKERVACISVAEMIQQAKKHLPFLFISDLQGLKNKGYRLAKKLIEDLVENNQDLKKMEPRTIMPILKDFMEHDVFAKLIYVVDTEGYLVGDYVTQPEDFEKYKNKLKEKNFSDRSWFKVAVENKSSAVSDFFISKVVDELCITVSKPIADEQDNLLGVIGIDVSFDNLIKLDEA